MTRSRQGPGILSPMDALAPFTARRTLCLSRSALLEAGVSVSAIAAAVHSGRLIRARRGWYLPPSAPELVVQAVRVGGRATCETALATYGVWVPGSPVPHVALPPRASRLRAPDDRRSSLRAGPTRAAELHWRPWRETHAEKWRVSRVDAIVHAAWCVAPDEFVAVLDSALYQRVIRKTDLAAMHERVPVERRRCFDRLDARAESGTESLVRLALRAAGLAVRSQARIEGVGRVDLLVQEKVVVEVDSDEWHSDEEAVTRDYHRDLVLFRSGFVVVRVSWFQAMFRRGEVVAAVRAAVAAVRRRR